MFMTRQRTNFDQFIFFHDIFEHGLIKDFSVCHEYFWFICVDKLWFSCDNLVWALTGLV